MRSVDVADPLPIPDTSLEAEVRHYLSLAPRQLPSNALYDELGSALFEAICRLPWYPITRAERRLIATYRREILRGAGWPDRLVELGPGSGEKLARLLESSPDDASIGHAEIRRVDLVDVSGSALAAASRLLREIQGLDVVTHQARYEQGLVDAVGSHPPDQQVLVLFLGSNIGNFDPPGADRFLATIRAALQPDDGLLIGADLVKPERELLLAYDDPLGVTAAFNRNLLVRLNREMGANFDLARFDHRAVWNRRESRVEMHLVSRARQRVEVPRAGLSLQLQNGEVIWTESSYKYQPADVDAMLQRGGLEPAHRWIDNDGGFVLSLARAV